MNRVLRAWLIVFGACIIPTIALAQPEESKDCVPQRVLLKFRVPWLYWQANRFAAAVGARVEGAIPQIGVLALQIPPGVDEKTYADALSQYGAVEFAEPDYIGEPHQTVIPNDPHFNLANLEGWHLARIGCPAAWARTRGSPRIIIAHLDTGVDAAHPDLQNKLVSGWNFYDNNADTNDVHGHGTATASILAAATGNGEGIASVAWHCRIMPLRVTTPSGGALSSLMAQAIVWAADRGARVAVIMHQIGDRRVVSEAAQYFMGRARGIVIHSAGNNGGFGNIPDDPDLIAVSALGIGVEEQIASWSTRGPFVDLCAPGEWIINAGRGGGYYFSNGTSNAAPIVAGVAALVLSVNPSLNAEQLRHILFLSANDLGEPGRDPLYGWGVVNAARAVAIARRLPMDSLPPILNVSGLSDGATISRTVTIRAEAADRSGIYRTRLYVNQQLVAARFSATAEFRWDSRSVPNGPVELLIEAQDGAGNRRRFAITVNVQN